MNQIVTKAAAAAPAIRAFASDPRTLFYGGLGMVVAGTGLTAHNAIQWERQVSALTLDLEKAEDLRTRSTIRGLLVKETAVRATPPLLLIGGGLLLVTRSHNLLVNQNKQLVLAYAALDTAYRKYRGRVAERYGKEVDEEFYYDQQISGYDAEGRPVLAELGSVHTALFHSSNPNWQPVHDFNLMFLTQTQNYMNDKLEAEGFLLLNDVLTALGLPRTTAGCLVGWMTERNGGGGFVDFMSRLDEIQWDPASNVARMYHLDFNVDGIIYDKIG